MNSVPTPDNKGFKFLSHGAQVLWFHLALRAKDDGGGLSVSESEAATLRKELGVGDNDVRELLRNGFIEARSGRVTVVEEGAYLPGPVVEQKGEQQVLFVYPGTRMVYWRETMEKYRREVAANTKGEIRI